MTAVAAGPVAAALRAFDDAALETLANPGLLRRAQRDVAEGKVAIAGLTADGLAVAADGETVTIDQRGPGFAQCTCPAPAMCRHRVAAVLIARSVDDDPQALAENDTSPDPAEATARLTAEIAALSGEAIARWAGRASWRAALDIAGEGGAVTTAGMTLVVRLAGSDDDIRFLAGQGLAGMISRTRPAQLKARHAAAMLVAQAHFGIETATAPPEARPSQVSIDPAFLADVEAALAQCARSALNLAPSALEEQLFMLSVSSRADSLPRLSAQLRGLAAILRDRRERSRAFDPDRCLAAIADAFALAGALRHRSGATPGDVLAGSVRQGYAPIGDLTLVGMGSDVWQTPAGARGVTAHFCDAGSGSWFSASLSRGAGLDPGFDPVSAYTSEGVWGGQTLARLSRSRFTLTGVAASASGRLSLANAVRATPALPRGVADDGFAAWPALRDHLRAQLAGGLVAPRMASLPVVLQPRRIGRPWFDALRQSLVWPIADGDGTWIGLSVDHGRDREQLLAALEQVAARGWHGSIIALASVEARTFALRPFALAAGDDLFNLGLDALTGLPALDFGQRAADLARDVGLWLGRLPTGATLQPPPVPMQVVAAALQILVDLAELGMEMLTADQATRLATAAEQLRAVGLASAATRLDAVAKPLAAARWPALLAAAFALQSARRQLIELPVVI